MNNVVINIDGAELVAENAFVALNLISVDNHFKSATFNYGAGEGLDGIGLVVEFAADNSAFITWMDMDFGKVYHTDNGSDRKNSVELINGICPEERMMCSDFDAIKEIMFEFCENGERSDCVKWIEEKV